MPPLPTLPKPARLRDQVFEAIRHHIRSGALAPDERLSEQGLADQLGVSRTPVREALFQLTRDGVLQEQARGYILPRLTGEDVQEITELRLLLEPPLVRRVAESRNTATIEGLARLVTRERATTKKPSARAFIAANTDFRRILFDACGNGRLAACAGQANDQIQWIRLQTLRDPDNRRSVVATHERLIAALRKGDADAAAQEMRTLIENAQKAFEARAGESA